MVAITCIKSRQTYYEHETLLDGGFSSHSINFNELKYPMKGLIHFKVQFHTSFFTIFQLGLDCTTGSSGSVKKQKKQTKEKLSQPERKGSYFSSLPSSESLKLGFSVYFLLKR